MITIEELAEEYVRNLDDRSRGVILRIEGWIKKFIPIGVCVVCDRRDFYVVRELFGNVDIIASVESIELADAVSVPDKRKLGFEVFTIVEE